MSRESGGSQQGGRRGGAGWSSLLPYLRILRVDHWTKNVFVLPGLLLAAFLRPDATPLPGLGAILQVIAATCLVASANYSINEYLDAPFDRLHPVKYQRPAVDGQVKGAWVLLQWLLLAAAGITLAWRVQPSAGICAGLLWLMGIVYNVPPLRSKDLPYLDVLSEAVNNPLRLGIGWFTVLPLRFPPLSLIIAYWMLGAFFMATKRLAEYRRIADAARAAAYRPSFATYNERRLLVSLFFYAQTAALFIGVFIVRYHLELILAIPLLALGMAWFLDIGLRTDSAAQRPEALYRSRGFALYVLGAAVLVLLLLFTRLPALYSTFRVQEDMGHILWELPEWGAGR